MLEVLRKKALAPVDKKSCNQALGLAELSLGPLEWQQGSGAEFWHLRPLPRRQPGPSS